MNLYFLVEGQSTEPDVYPAWLSYIPELSRVENFDEVEENNYYLFSSYGIPSVEDDIVNAVIDINSIGKYNHFAICIDADAATVDQRETKILDLLAENETYLTGASLDIIVQNRCMETWFLGNRKVYTRNPQKDSRFIEYSRYYNVSRDDPESMEKPETFLGSISRFHLNYLKSMFNERGNMTYSKSNSLEIQKNTYLNEIINRVNENPHLKTFRNFIDFCAGIKKEIVNGR